MIRLNLLTERTANQAVGQGKEAGFFSDLQGAGAGAMEGVRLSARVSGGSIGIVIKIAAAVAPLIAVLLFEQIQLSSKAAEKNQLQQQFTKLQQESVALKPKIEASIKLRDEKAKLQVQIDTIKKLSTERLYNVKALSALQTLIPAKAWLTHLKFEGPKADIVGKAVDEAAVYEFVRGLESSIFFSGVLLKKVEDISDTNDSEKSFDLTCNLETP